MIVYHGTMDRYAESIYSDGILLSKSKHYLDFGRGFYSTPDITLAEKTAKTITYKNNLYGNRKAAPAIVTFMVDENILEELKVALFDGFSHNWKRFVVNNRLGEHFLDFIEPNEHNIDKKYDVVFGETADGNIGSYIDSIRRGELSFSPNVYASINYGFSLGKQLSFHTSDSLKSIKYINTMILRSEIK